MKEKRYELAGKVAGKVYVLPVEITKPFTTDELPRTKIRYITLPDVGYPVSGDSPMNVQVAVSDLQLKESRLDPEWVWQREILNAFQTLERAWIENAPGRASCCVRVAAEIRVRVS